MIIRATLVFALLVGSLPVVAQTTTSSLNDVAAAPAATPYLPSIADLMTSAVQPRHVKLSLAVREQNWTYAAYEINELRNAFRRIARAIPVYDQKINTEALLAMIDTPTDSLAAAIKAKDNSEARRAMVALTATCNACHAQVLQRSYIVIVDPKESAFPDQNFRAR